VGALVAGFRGGVCLAVERGAVLIFWTSWRAIFGTNGHSCPRSEETRPSVTADERSGYAVSTQQRADVRMANAELGFVNLSSLTS